MEKKICTKCKEEKDISKFGIYKRKGIEKRHGACLKCQNKQKKKYFSSTNYSKINIDLSKQEFEHCNKCNKTKKLIEFRKRNTKQGGYELRCKECYNSERKNYSSYSEWKKYRYKNYKKHRETYNKYRRERLLTDPLYNFKCRLRKRTGIAFKRSKWSKNSTNETMLGCDYKTAFNHIESQFKEGMSWENRSEWHIDHIIPLASAKNEDELIKLCHYTNLQPLWAEENLKKGDKIL